VIPASTILDSASTTLLDVAHRTWPESELLGYLNEAQLATAAARPTDFYVIEEPLTLVAGVTQTLPPEAITLIDIPRNSSTSPVPGRVVTQVDKGLQDEADRFWPRGTPQAEVEHFTFDPRNPRRWVAYPPNNGQGVVDAVYGAIPPTLMYTEQELVCPDWYQTPLTNFVLSKAYEKNAKRQDLTKATAYMQLWGQALGLETKTIEAAMSKVAASPGTT
jgi:hypothetical protein